MYEKQIFVMLHDKCLRGWATKRVNWSKLPPKKTARTFFTTGQNYLGNNSKMHVCLKNWFISSIFLTNRDLTS
jgi:hypothetical protein